MTPQEVVQAVMEETESMSRPVYRGQAKADWRPLSGAVRRLKAAHGEEVLEDEDALRKRLDEYQKHRLIDPMKLISRDGLSDIEILSVLQHNGAATMLLDFTENPLVALWNVCAEQPNEEGRVFILDIENHHIAINGRLEENPLDVSSTIVYYEPNRTLSTRILTQQSVFLICNPLLPENLFKSIKIPAKSKPPLRRYLTTLGISDEFLYGDVPGLATLNSANKPLLPKDSVSPTQLLKIGNRAYQEMRYEDALAAYESFVEAFPDVSQPHCLKGDALSALGRFGEAKRAYTKAIENLDRAFLAGERVLSRNEVLVDLMSGFLYFNRGNVQAAIGDHQDAVSDFDNALHQNPTPTREALYNRGNSKFLMQIYSEAYKDFEAASSERAGSDVALAMGNCKVIMGNFEEALDHYLTGTTLDPEKSATACLNNSNLVNGILEMLDGHEYEVRNENFVVFVEAACLGGSFPFEGNVGNSGNLPSGMVTAHGGKGYKGIRGFAVEIVPPTKPKMGLE